MAEIKKSLKSIWLKSMEAISNTASNIASNTKYKVDEMNIVNRRREILSDFGAQAYELWQKGEHFPECLVALLRELSELDEALNAIRTEKLAGVNTDDGASNLSKDTPDASDAAEADDAEEPSASPEKPVSSVSEKIDSAVETMGETIKKLGNKIEGGIEALSRAMKPKPEEKPADAAPEEAQPAAEQPESAPAEESAVPVIDVKEETTVDVPVTSQTDPQEPKAPEMEMPCEEEQEH